MFGFKLNDVSKRGPMKLNGLGRESFRNAISLNRCWHYLTQEQLQMYVPMKFDISMTIISVTDLPRWCAANR